MVLKNFAIGTSIDRDSSKPNLKILTGNTISKKHCFPQKNYLIRILSYQVNIAGHIPYQLQQVALKCEASIPFKSATNKMKR